MARTLYLIDAYAQIFRAYYAIRGGMRSRTTGESTHAVFGFTNMMLKLLSQLEPTYIVVATDMPGGTFRDQIYLQYDAIRQGDNATRLTEGTQGLEPGTTVLGAQYTEYKGTRNVTPDDLISQVPRVYEVVEGLGVPVIGQQGIEADDVIATITTRVLNDPELADVQIRIVSKDKDLEQLICDRVSLYDIHTELLITAEELMTAKGIKPEQVVDVLALMGDTADNVPGIEGIGPKTAAQLIQDFGSIDGILEHIDEIKGKKKESLLKGRDILPISRAMVTLKKDADFPFDISSARAGRIDVAKLSPVFEQLGFGRAQEEIRKLASKYGAAEASATPASPAEKLEPVASPSGAFEGVPYETAASGVYTAITTLPQMEKLVANLREYPIISIDTETTGLDRSAHLVGLSFAWKVGQGVYVPVASPNPESHLDLGTVLQHLKPVLEDYSVPKCGHNLKFDASVLARNGVHLRGVEFDTLLASQLIDPSRSAHKLDSLATDELYYKMIPITDLIGAGDQQLTMDQVPLDTITRYAAEDADISLRLYKLMKEKSDQAGLTALMQEIEAPLTAVLAEMENNGILCDGDVLVQQGKELAGRVTQIQTDIFSLVGMEFKIESTQQLADVLFDRLGFTEGKKTKTGRSTDISVLEKLASQENKSEPVTAVPRLVMEYRQLTKLISTYLGNLRDSIDRNTGRIHTTFHQLVTATGRLASNNPNLQNIPVRSDAGRQIRRAFHAPEGYRLICADYSQIELRFLAHLSEDSALLDAFMRDLDIHTAVASQVFQTPVDQVTKDQRAKAKTINFGIIYGITPFGLSRRIEGLEVGAATALIEDYRTKYPGIHDFLQACIAEALETGKVKTVTGRMRAIPEIHANNRVQRNLGERLAINTVVQGSAADLIKAAMVNLAKRIDRDHLPLKMLLQIHDELVLEAPAELAEAMAAIVCEEMEAAMTLRVPLRAEAGIGADWLSAK